MKRSLESRYVKLLVWYPKSWRKTSGDALVGILLDVAQSENRDRPTMLERFSIAKHGMAARMEELASSEIRDTAATIAFAMGAAFALISFLVSSWVPWGDPYFPTAFDSKVGPFYDAGPVLTHFWAIGIVCFLARSWRWGRLALLLSVLAAIAMPFLTSAFHPEALGLDATTRLFFGSCALVATLGKPRRGALAASVAAGSAILVWVAFSQGRPFQLPGGQPIDVVWNHYVVDVWYAGIVLLLVATSLAVMRRWNHVFTIVLVLIPAATVLVAYTFESRIIAMVTALTVAVPDAIGIVALILYSGGHLTLPLRGAHSRLGIAASMQEAGDASVFNLAHTETTTPTSKPTRLPAMVATIVATTAILALVGVGAASTFLSPKEITARSASTSHPAASSAAAPLAPRPSILSPHPGQKLVIEPTQLAWQLEISRLAKRGHASSITVDLKTGRVLSVTSLGFDTANR